VKKYFEKRCYPQYERASQIKYKAMQVIKRIRGEFRYKYDRRLRDTYGLSFPRSGRHWMTIMLELYHGGPVFSDSFRDEYAARTHINSWVHGEDPLFSGKRVLFIYRNPLDVMYSFHIYWATYDPLIPETRHYESDDPDISHVEARLKGWMDKWC